MIDEPSDIGGLCFSRVLVVGANGAGKTWLAQRLGLPVISKDGLALTTRWRQRPREEVSAAIKAQIAAELWVLEGRPSILTDDALGRAQLIVWLDIPASVRVPRILWRSVKYFGRHRPEHPPGNRDWPWRRQMRFVIRAWRNHGAFTNAIETALSRTDRPVARLRSRAEVSDFLLKFIGPGAKPV